MAVYRITMTIPTSNIEGNPTYLRLMLNKQDEMYQAFESLDTVIIEIEDVDVWIALSSQKLLMDGFEDIISSRRDISSNISATCPEYMSKRGLRNYARTWLGILDYHQMSIEQMSLVKDASSQL